MVATAGSMPMRLSEKGLHPKGGGRRVQKLDCKFTESASMNNTFFTPWIGPLYGKQDSLLAKRVMVVGASHYCGHGCRDCGDASAHPECAGFTQEVISDYLDGNGSGDWRKTFTTFVNSVFGRLATADECFRLFDSIVFANFLQKAEGKDASEKHDEYFREPVHVESLKTTIHECRPDVVVTWGSRVWNAIPWDLGFGKAEQMADSIVRYPFEGGSFILLGLHHPSIGYPSNDSHQLLARVGAAVM